MMKYFSPLRWLGGNRRRTRQLNYKSRRRFLEPLERRDLLSINGGATANAWHNVVDAYDVNGDSRQSPLDALVVINAINSGQGGPLDVVPLAKSNAAPDNRFVDVNNDSILSPLDALLVINELATPKAQPIRVAAYHLRVTRPGADPTIPANELFEVRPGDEFDLHVLVEDLRTGVVFPGTPDGITDAFLDVIFDSVFVQPVTGELIFSNRYPDAECQTGNLLSDEIDEAGGCTSLSVGAGQIPLFHIRMEATREGLARFFGNPADVEGNETKLFGLTLPVLTEGQSFFDTSLLIQDIQEPQTGIVIQPSSNSILEGNVGTRTVSFDIALTSPVSVPVHVSYGTVDGSAQVADNDYVPSSGRLTFLPGDPLFQTVVIQINSDTKLEANETFFLSLTNPINGFIAGGPATTTILNDDTTPEATVSIGDAQIIEGDSGTTEMLFTVTLSAAAASAVSVNYQTTGNTATSGVDFVPGSGTVEFLPGETTKTISVTINGDTELEEDETFSVNLLNPSQGLAISDSQGIGTILDDDSDVSEPTISVGDSSVNEGDSGTTPLPFTITLSETSNVDIVINYVISPDTATEGVDYSVVVPEGPITIPAGESEAVVLVDVIGDEDVESDETLTIELSSASSGIILNSTGTGTIIDDDGGNGSQGVTIDFVDLSEGDSGEMPVAEFTVTLDSPQEIDVTIDFSTADDTAIAGEDYEDTSGSITIPAGETVGTIMVPIIADNRIEADETFFVNLIDPFSGSPDPIQGVATILNDDSALLSLQRVDVSEGNEGQTIVELTVALSNPSDFSVTLAYETSDGSATEENEDFVPQSGQIVLSPGETEVSVTLFIVGDRVEEDDEEFFVQFTLTDGENVELLTDQVAVGILNDDASQLLEEVNIVVGFHRGGR